MRRTPKQREMNNPATLFRNIHTDQAYEDFMSLTKLTKSTEYTARSFLSNFRSIAIRTLICAYSNTITSISKELYQSVLSNESKAMDLFDNQLKRQKNSSKKMDVFYRRLGRSCRMLTTKEVVEELQISKSTATRYFERCLICLHDVVFHEGFEAAMLQTSKVKKTGLKLTDSSARIMQQTVDNSVTALMAESLLNAIHHAYELETDLDLRAADVNLDAAQRVWNIVRRADDISLLSKYIIRLRLQTFTPREILQVRADMGLLSKPIECYKNVSQTTKNAWSQLNKLLLANRNQIEKDIECYKVKVTAVSSSFEGIDELLKSLRKQVQTLLAAIAQLQELLDQNRR